jgi:hypothetical protein
MPVAGVTSLGDIIIRSNDPLNPAAPLPVSVDVRELRGTTRMLASAPEIPIDRDVTVVFTPAAQVRVERGHLFHRAAGAVAFTDSIELEPSRGNFLGIIPAEKLYESGLEYYIRVENSGVFDTDPVGAPVVFYSRDVAPPVSVVAEAVPNDGQRYAQGAPVTVQATLPPGSVFQRGWVYYREGATAAYDTVAMTGNGDTAEGVIPGEASDLRGIDYWIEVKTISATLTAPAAAPQGNPYSIQTTLANVADARSHPGMQHRLMSFPADVQGTAQGAIVDDLGGADDTRWRLFSYTGATSTTKYVEIEDIPHFEHGKAYWIITRDAYRIDTAPEVSLSTDTSVPFERKLDPGWNLVGNPFSFDVAWSSVMRDTMAVPDPPQAYNGSTHVLATTLNPFSGYWVHNDADSVVSMWIPPVEDTGAPTMMPAAPLAWAVSVSAANEGIEQRVKFGVSANAKDARDGLDRLLPPAVPESPMDLYAIDEAGRSLSNDVRAQNTAAGWGHAWTFDVAVAKNGRVPVTLGFDFDSVPDDADVLLLDREVKRTHTVDASGIEVFITGSARKSAVEEGRFVLLVGDVEYIEEHRSLLPGLPTQTALHQNFPNPFNPTTVIRYELAAPSRVSLRVYDVRGALVRTLEDRSLSAGRYEVGWDGVDNRGGQVASGIYFYRLVNGEGIVLTRKMVLLK